MASVEIPGTLLQSFFERATTALNALDISSHDSSGTGTDAADWDSSASGLSPHRRAILQVQQSCLSQVLDDYNQAHSTASSLSLNQMQVQLQRMETHVEYDTLEPALQRMTLAARQALARLVLQQELQFSTPRSGPRSGTRSGPRSFGFLSSMTTTSTPTQQQQQQSSRLTRTAVLEFCGLCQAVVLLGPVQEFLSSRGPNRPDDALKLYDMVIPNSTTNDNTHHTKLITPQERLHYIQTLLFHALGYPDAHDANQQLASVIEGDAELEPLFFDTMTQLRSVLRHATHQWQQQELNDFEEGGVTRVISTVYSEHSNEDGDAMMVPMGFDMARSEDGVTNTIMGTTTTMTRQTDALEQTLLAQLLQMDSSDRDSMLEQARVAQEDLLKALAELTTAPEKVAYMTTSLSQETQQLLLMHRIWQGLLDRNQGKPPKMASTRDRDY